MIEMENIRYLNFTEKEYEAFNTVIKIMDTLKLRYPEETIDSLINPLTGEIVEPKEFSRVKSVINFITDNPFREEFK